MDRIHFISNVSLPTPSARAAARATLEDDVAKFIANGGEICQVPYGVSRDSSMPFTINPKSAGMATMRPSSKNYGCTQKADKGAQQ